MMEIIQIISLIVTSATAIISAWIAICTLRQNNKMIEESTRPYILIYTTEINSGNLFMYLVVKNNGASSAKIERIDINPCLKGMYKIPNDKDFLKDLEGCSIAPSQSKICLLDFEKIPKKVEIKITYSSSVKKRYTEEMIVNLKAGATLPKGKTSTKGKELRTISYVLQEMLEREL